MLVFSKRILPLCLPILLSASPLVHAEGFTLGLQSGISDIEWDQFKDDTSTQIYAGYHFLPWLGLEAAATDLGEFKVKNGNSGVEVSTREIVVAMQDDLGLWDLDVGAKVGVYNADMERTCSNCATRNEESATGLTYSAYLFKPITSFLGITAGWQFYREMDDTAINVYQLGLRLNF